MPGLCFSNKLIICNKGLHCNFACLIYAKLINRLPAHCILEIISSEVDIELEFVVNALPVVLIGMNLTMMCNYICQSAPTRPWLQQTLQHQQPV